MTLIPVPSCRDRLNSDRDYDPELRIEPNREGLGLGYYLVCRYCNDPIQMISRSEALKLKREGKAHVDHDVEFDLEIGSQL